MWQYEKKAMLSVYDDFSSIMYEGRSLKTYSFRHFGEIFSTRPLKLSQLHHSIILSNGLWLAVGAAL